MICVSCAGKLEPSMRHAMLSNLCPFCGQNIFTPAEANHRKSIYRILLKNGIENDDLIARLVDDLSDAVRKDISPAVEDMAVTMAASRPRRPVAASIAENAADGGEEIEVTDEEDDDDESELPPEARSAPSRVLTPDPRTRPAAPAPTNSSKVDQAMRAFEALQAENDEAKSERFDADTQDPAGDELERQFLKSAGVDPGAVLPKPGVPARPTRPGGFKNTPVRRA